MQDAYMDIDGRAKQDARAEEARAEQGNEEYTAIKRIRVILSTIPHPSNQTSHG